MEGWSGILRSDGREVAAPRDLAQIGPALGSSLSDAEVMECTCHPCESKRICVTDGHNMWLIQQISHCKN